MNDRIEKQIELMEPVSRVWRALTDYQEFGGWFGAKFDGYFVPDGVSRGQITSQSGCEHHKFEITVKKMELESLFSFTWHPYALDTQRDYSVEKPRLDAKELQT